MVEVKGHLVRVKGHVIVGQGQSNSGIWAHTNVRLLQCVFEMGG